jgi:NNP family nitrate/nitrite transporter-like MFS transporter
VRARVASIYLLLFATEVAWLAMVPLAPRFKEQLGLSTVETGVVLAAAGFAMLAVALPIGLLADRVGARRLTLVGGAVLVASHVWQGLADGYGELLAARTLFGVGMGIVWTAGLAVLSTVPDGRLRSFALGGTITTAGAASVTGPVAAGFLGDEVGLGTPFLVVAGLTAVATVALAVTGSSAVVAPAPARAPLRSSIARGAYEHYVLAAVLLMVMLGLVNGSINLLVPLELRANGLSAGEIGLAFSVSSAVFVAATIVVTRAAGAGRGLGMAGVAAGAYAILLGLPFLTTATVALLVFVVVRGPAWATISTLPYPLGAIGADRAGVGYGTVVGVLNVAWGGSNAVGPLLAGALAGVGGSRLGLVPAICACFAVAVWLRGASTRRSSEVLA